MWLALFGHLNLCAYRKNSKNWDTWNNYHNGPTIGTVGFYSAVLCSKDADRITNREDPDQTAPWGAVWSGSALFAQTYLSQYLKLLRYVQRTETEFAKNYLVKNSWYSILFYPLTFEGRWGTTDEFATIPFHLVLFSAALVELANSIPVHSLIMSSHLFAGPRSAIGRAPDS